MPALAGFLALATGASSATPVLPCGAGIVTVGPPGTTSSWTGRFATGGSAAASTAQDGTGSVTLTSVARLVPKKAQRVTLWAGACATSTKALAYLGTGKSSAAGRLTQTFSIPSAAAIALGVTPGLASVTVGTGKGQRCVTLHDQLPSALYVDESVRIPASLYGGPIRLQVGRPMRVATCDWDVEPDPLREYAMSAVLVEAIGDSSISPLDFALRGADGTQYEVSFGRRDHQFDAGTLVAGSKRSGQVTFEVPLDVMDGTISVLFTPVGLGGLVFTVHAATP